MHCLENIVIFDGGLFISVLRNEQLFTKKKGPKVHIFKLVQISFFCLERPFMFFISSPTQNAIQKNHFSHLGPHPSF
jgi:hypothetical protein